MTDNTPKNPLIVEILEILGRYAGGQDDALHQLENYAEGICLISEAKGRVIANNEKLDEMFGYKPGEIAILGDSLVAFPSFSADLNLNTIAVQIHKEGFWIGTAPYLRKDNSTFYCQSTIIPFEHARFATVWAILHTEIHDKNYSPGKAH